MTLLVYRKGWLLTPKNGFCSPLCQKSWWELWALSLDADGQAHASVGFQGNH